MWRVVVALMVLASGASADDFGGFTFKVPAGYKSERTGSLIRVTKFSGKTFCQYALYASRAPTNDDAAFEWANVVANTFPTITAKKPITAKTKNLTYVSTTADVADAGGNKFAITHYLLLSTSAVSSLVAVSNTSASLAKCPSKAFVDSLAFASAPVSAPTPLTGTWATSATSGNNGYSRRQYTLDGNGTYRYYSEAWGGALRSTWYYVVDETGKWTLAGDQLTLTPTKSVGTEYSGDSKKTQNRSLTKATVTAKKVYMDGLQEWNLVMSSGGDRDGTFTDTYKPEWKFPPP